MLKTEFLLPVRSVKQNQSAIILQTYNVVEDMKLFNEGDNVPQGYIALDKTDDSGVFFISYPFCRTFENEAFNCFSLNKLGEKAFRGKVLHAKISLRFYTDIAISDIVILVKQKRAPPGYSLVGFAYF